MLSKAQSPVLQITALVVLIMASSLIAPDISLAFPNPGSYEAEPGSSTNLGPFSGLGVLAIDEVAGTGTFDFGGVSYQGSFSDPTTLVLSGTCYDLPAGGSELPNWLFSFETDNSFAWTGSLTEF